MKQNLFFNGYIYLSLFNFYFFNQPISIIEERLLKNNRFMIILKNQNQSNTFLMTYTTKIFRFTNRIFYRY